MTSNVSIQLSARLLCLAAALGLFALLYSLTNVYAQTLFDDIQSSGFDGVSTLWPKMIYTLATPFDTAIPFISVMIIPYSWSILLFCASFFMVQTRQQLSFLTRRLVLATLLACFMFYLFPAKFTFERPPISDWTQFGYQFLSLTDKPFNQLPSLHVTYAALLGLTLWQVSTSFFYRLILCSVCSLIIVSTVFTYQHHLLDVAGGLLLAVIVMFIANHLHNNLVLKYLAVAISGFIVLSILGFMVNRSLEYSAIEGFYRFLTGYWLISFFGVAWVYQYPNRARYDAWFKKDKQGRLSLSTWIRFTPLLLGYHLMWYSVQWYELVKYNRYQITPFDLSKYKVTDSVYAIATPKLFRLSNNNYYNHLDFSYFNKVIVIDSAVEANSHYLSLMKRLDNHLDNHNDTHKNQHSTTLVQVTHIYFPLLDLQSFTKKDIQDIIRLFEKIDPVVKKDTKVERSDDETILINFHCVMGLSRSVALHVLYLVYRRELTVDNYATWIVKHYPKAHVDDHYLPKSVVAALYFLTQDS